MKWQFWRWLVCGLEAKPGWRQFTLGWSLFHAAAGVGLAYLVPKPLSEVAFSILIPLAGILAGVSFSWIGNALTLLRSEEIETLASFHPDGLQTYIYTFQLTVLVILVTVTLWAISGLGLLDWQEEYPRLTFAAESTLFFFAGLSLREAWHVVMGSHELLLIRSRVRKAQEEEAGKSSES